MVYLHLFHVQANVLKINLSHAVSVQALDMHIGIFSFSKKHWIGYLLLNQQSVVGWLEFNVPFQHKYGYIKDDNQHSKYEVA